MLLRLASIGRLSLALISNRSITNQSSLSYQVNSCIQQIKSSRRSENGLFGHRVLSSVDGFYLFRQAAVLEADQLVKEATDYDRKRKIVQVFDQLSNCLCKVADLSEFIRIAHPDRNYCHAAEQTSIAINAEVEKLNTNRPLYNALVNAIRGGDVVATSPTDDYVARLFLFDFEQSGIHLDEETRKELVQLNEHIHHVGTYFMHGTSKPCIISRDEIPAYLLEHFHSDGKRLIISGLQNDSDNAETREIAFKRFLQYDDQQEQLLLELIYSRLKLAKICGFDSFAQRAINGSIAETPHLVWDFINSLNDLVRSKSDQDFHYMLQLKNKDLEGDNRLMQWDVPYYSQTHRNIRFGSDIHASSPYFSLGSCMEGLDLIFNSIFNVQLQICGTNEEDLWHPSVIKLAVTDLANQTTLGYIYCDFFVRPHKPFHDCHFTIQGGCQLPNGEWSPPLTGTDVWFVAGDYQPPIVVIFLGFPNATSSCPTLLSPSMVDNLFHEMGHAMHSMLARTTYQHITGTRCSTDLAEVPSILMEYFASDYRVVSKFAKHYSTGEAIPEPLLRSWIESKSLFAASDLQLQIFYSALDQVYHSENPLRGCSNSTDVLNQIQNQYYGIANVCNTSWQLRFGHLVGYGAKYYSYLISKAVANSIWKKLFEMDPLSSTAGQFYRREVLSHGGGKPPKQIVESVLQQQVDPGSLATSLVQSISDCNKL